MKKNKTFIFIIPFIFISFLCFANNVEAKKVCDLGGDLRNDDKCYKKLPETITGVASTMNIYCAVEKAPSDIKEMVNSKKRNSKIEYDTTISNCAFIYDALEETTTESQIETTNTSSTTKVSTSNNVRLYKTVTCGNTELPENLAKLISIAITAIQVVTPLILIVTGMLDFLKATTASNEDGIKKAQQTFVRRLIAGAAVFFIILAVKIVVGLINTEDSKSTISCLNKLLNYKTSDEVHMENLNKKADECAELYNSNGKYKKCLCELFQMVSKENYKTTGEFLDSELPDAIKKYPKLRTELEENYENSSSSTCYGIEN